MFAFLVGSVEKFGKTTHALTTVTLPKRSVAPFSALCPADFSIFFTICWRLEPRLIGDSAADPYGQHLYDA